MPLGIHKSEGIPRRHLQVCEVRQTRKGSKPVPLPIMLMAMLPGAKISNSRSRLRAFSDRSAKYCAEYFSDFGVKALVGTARN